MAVFSLPVLLAAVFLPSAEREELLHRLGISGSCELSTLDSPMAENNRKGRVFPTVTMHRKCTVENWPIELQF